MTNEERITNSKNKIFEAALAEFSSNGYAGSSINNITRAGIPKGLLYHIYKNKDEVYLACVERCYQELMIYFPDLKMNLREYMAARQKFFSEHSDMGQIIYETFRPVSPEVDEQIHAIRKPFDDFNQKCFRYNLEKLQLREGVSEELAMQYFSLVQFAMNSYFVHVSSDQGSDEAWLKHEAALPDVLNLVFYGIVDNREEK